MLCHKVAKGRFTLDMESGRTEHLLLATVTGIAPIASCARTMYKDWKIGGSPMPGATTSSTVYQEEVAPGKFGYREELGRIAAEVPWFKFVATISRPGEDTAWTGETGGSTIGSENTPVCGNCGPQRQTRTFVGMPACAKTGQASFSAVAGRKAPSSQRFISYRRR
jgi:ferredoxin-NADP reductase